MWLAWQSFFLLFCVHFLYFLYLSFSQKQNSACNMIRWQKRATVTILSLISIFKFGASNSLAMDTQWFSRKITSPVKNIEAINTSLILNEDSADYSSLKLLALFMINMQAKQRRFILLFPDILAEFSAVGPICLTNHPFLFTMVTVLSSIIICFSGATAKQKANFQSVSNWLEGRNSDW